MGMCSSKSTRSRFELDTILTCRNLEQQVLNDRFGQYSGMAASDDVRYEDFHCSIDGYSGMVAAKELFGAKFESKIICECHLCEGELF